MGIETPADAGALPQRARGVLHIAARAAGDGRRSRLSDLRQQGCLRACFPNAEGAALQALVLNTSGGITDGDILQASFSAAAGASLTLATPAAERIYRARPGSHPASVQVHIAVAAGARVEYLPQETILFQHCALDRRLSIDLHETGTYLGVETLVFGRAASGEVLHQCHVRDCITLRRSQRLVLQDCVNLIGPAARTLAARATAGGAGAVASIVYAAPDAAVRLGALRDALAAAGPASGASFRDGLIVARIVAADGAQARHAAIAGLCALRDENPLPRAWTC